MSAKPTPFVAKPKPVVPLTWETFHRSQPISRGEDVFGACMTRIKYRQATSVLIRLTESGCSIRIDEDRLLIKPGESISDDDKRMIGMVKNEIMNLIREGCLARFDVS